MFLKNFLGNKKIFLILGALFLNFLAISSALAAAGDYKQLVPIPGINPNAGLYTYLNGVYTFLISIVGILAMAVLVYGGMRYITSAGNTASVEEAKESINSALTGLVLALVSWLIFSTINPDILVLKPVGVGLPGGKYGYSGENSNCALPTGTGTTNAPCHCIDDPLKDVFGASLIGTKTSLTLAVAPNPGGVGDPILDTVHMTGTLTDASGKPISGATIKINRINTILNASYIFTAITDAGGNYTDAFNSAGRCATSASGDIMQAVFAGGTVGGTSYAGTGSNTINFVLKGSTPCVRDDYDEPLNGPVAVLWTGGNDCNAICSDKALAQDGEYHCLVAGVRMGQISNPAGLTDDQQRAFATSFGTNANPFTAFSGFNYVFEVERYSRSFYPIVEYTHDTDENMSCDAPLTDIGWHKAHSVYSTPSGVACTTSLSPKAEICGQTFCIKDSQGNEASTIIYYEILAP